MHSTRIVRDDAVNAEIQQRLHLIQIVDGPYVDLDPVCVCVIDEFSCDEGPLGEGWWHLQRHDALWHWLVFNCTGHGFDDFPKRGAQRRLERVFGEHAAQILHDVVLARCQQRSIGSIKFLDQVESGSDAFQSATFDLEIEARIGKALEGFFEGWNGDALSEKGCFPRLVAELPARVERSDLGPIRFRSGASTVTRSVQRRVMQEDWDAVTRDMNVALENLRAHGKCRVKGSQRIFRAVAGRTAMADHDGSIDVEEGMHHVTRLLSCQLGYHGPHNECADPRCDLE